ncbi:MAG: long-chain-fatty-acid--CoA ligase [Deltaproteobacteria bacterium]|nr:long-chain-fatty-acid--CoA ligase [Deltaproteobacteria bacterium]
MTEGASRDPDRIAVEDGDRRTSYAELGHRTLSLARCMHEAGLRPGDRVAILEDNTGAFLESYYACAAAGLVAAPLNTRLSPREIGFILDDAGARWALASKRHAGLIQDGVLERIVWTDSEGWEDMAGGGARGFEPPAVSEEDVAHLYYTSGTTGRPKGVMLTHRNVCIHARSAIDELSITHSDVWGHIAPMFHLADAWAVFAVTWAGGRHVMVPRFEAGDALRAVQEHRITLSNLIPTMLNLMVKHPAVEEFDLSSLRVVLSGGAPIAPELVRRVMEVFGCDYIQTYGMTETCPYLTLSILEDHLLDLPVEKQLEYRSKTGRPFKGVDLRVVGEDGEPVAADERQVGEIQVRGPTVTPGYWNLPEETLAAFRDGWLCTGDLAVLDGEGYVNIVDRRKDMIITGGENVYSIEVENALYENPKILEAAVFGVGDERWGESVRAAVVLGPGEEVGEAEIIEWCRARLASFKVPRGVVFLSDLPRTGSGKISKRTLRDRYG